MAIDFIQFCLQFMLANFLFHYLHMKLIQRNKRAEAAALAYVS
jgi:hypothetical protein